MLVIGLLVIRSMSFFFLFFFNDTATTEIYTLSLHDALPIFGLDGGDLQRRHGLADGRTQGRRVERCRENTRDGRVDGNAIRSEEHTSELQSRLHLVCRLLLEKKKKEARHHTTEYIALDETSL